MRTYYQIEAEHERKIIRQYNDLGFEGIRSAGSKGAHSKEHKSLIDLVVWNKEIIVFIASQCVPWDVKKQKWIWESFKIRPPNSKMFFRGIDYYGREIIEDGDELAEREGWKR